MNNPKISFWISIVTLVALIVVVAFSVVGGSGSSFATSAPQYVKQFFDDGIVINRGSGGCNGTVECGLRLGNDTQDFQLNFAHVTTSTFGQFVLGSYVNATSTTSTQVTIPGVANWVATTNDYCQATIANAPTSTSFGSDCFITAAGTSSATATVTFWNGAASVVTIPTTTIRVLDWQTQL